MVEINPIGDSMQFSLAEGAVGAPADPDPAKRVEDSRRNWPQFEKWTTDTRFRFVSPEQKEGAKE
jgi:hypothetical protein